MWENTKANIKCMKEWKDTSRNKHKDDNVSFNFEKNTDYMNMGKVRTKKWHYLDIRNKK